MPYFSERNILSCVASSLSFQCVSLKECPQIVQYMHAQYKAKTAGAIGDHLYTLYVFYSFFQNASLQTDKVRGT